MTTTSPSPETEARTASVTDVEALRREIERLRASAAASGLLDAVLRHSPYGIIVSDAAGKLVLHNRAAETIWAGSATTAGIDDWAKYRAFHDDGRPYRADEWAMARCLATREVVPPHEIRILRFDGTPGVLLGGCAPLFDARGDLDGALSIFADITAWKEAERTLAQSERQYQQILDSVQEMVFCKDENLTVVYANRATCRYYGMTAEELRGVTDVPFNERDFTQQYLRDDARVLSTGETVEVLEEPNVAPSGELRFFHTIKAPIRDDRGKVVRLVGVSRDITERRRADRRLALHHAVSSILAEARSAEDALRAVIAELAEALEWRVGAYWTVHGGDELRCSFVWRKGDDALVEPFVELTRRSVFRTGTGLPGQVLQRRAPAWLPDVQADAIFTRRDVAAAAGLHGAFAFPITVGEDVVGVVELYAPRAQAADVGMMQLSDTVGRQLGLFLERVERDERREFMAKASAILSTDLDVRRVFADLAKLAVPTIGDWCAVDVLAEGGGIERVVVEHMDPSKVALAQELDRRYPPDPDSPHGVPHVLRTGETEWSERVPDELLVAAARDAEHLALARSLGLRSYAVVPLKARGRVLGALTVVYAESNRTYRRRDVEALEELASRAALALDNALLFADAERKAAALEEERAALEALNRVSRFVSGELDTDKLVQHVTDAATSLSGAEFGAFFYNVVDAAGQSYMLYTISGVPREAFSRFPMPRNTAIFAPTFAGEGIVRSDDITKDPRYGKNAPYRGMPEGHLPVRSYLAVPVVSRSGSVIGGLFFGHSRCGVFSERSEKLVSALASQAAVAMDNARLFREAQSLIGALERSNKELDQFAYVASHDLKAPLRGIANLSEWIEEDLGDALHGESKRQMTLLRGRVHRMEALIDGILSYSRAGRRSGKPEELDVGALVRDAVELLSPAPTARVVVGEGLPKLVAERTPLQQVFLNLVGNALKHAKREDAHVTVSGTKEGDAWHFVVRDNGPGIAPEFHERIWGIFQTLEARDTVESTGIGLAVVRKIVEAQGGRAWVESKEGEGAAFHFTWKEPK